jgi:hypothetical protein
MSRIITSIHVDLKFLAGTTPPAITVHYVDRDANGAETEGKATILDAQSQDLVDRLLLDGTKQGLISAVRQKVDEKDAAATALSRQELLSAISDAEVKLKER